MLRLLVILSKDSTIAFYGAILSAAVFVPYFLLTLVAIYLVAQG